MTSPITGIAAAAAQVRRTAADRSPATWLLVAAALSVPTGAACLAASNIFPALLSPFFVLAVPCFVALGVALLAIWAGLNAAAQRMLHLPRHRARTTALAILGAGCVPWLLPDALSMPVDAPGLPLITVWSANSAVLLLAATAAIPTTRARRTAGLLTALTLLAWLPARYLITVAAVDDAVHHFGNPPRALLRTLQWGTLTPDSMAAESLQYADGRVTVTYMDTMAFQGSMEYYLTVENATGKSPCDVPLPPDPPSGPTDCHPIGPDLWSRGDNALVLQRDGLIMQLSGDALKYLEPALLSEHPSDDLEILAIPR